MQSGVSTIVARNAKPIPINTVVPIEKVHLEHGEGHGKGNVLWASLLAIHGYLVVWIDGDITLDRAELIRRCAGPPPRPFPITRAEQEPAFEAAIIAAH